MPRPAQAAVTHAISTHCTNLWARSAAACLSESCARSHRTLGSGKPSCASRAVACASPCIHPAASRTSRQIAHSCRCASRDSLHSPLRTARATALSSEQFVMLMLPPCVRDRRFRACGPVSSAREKAARARFFLPPPKPGLFLEPLNPPHNPPLPSPTPPPYTP